MTAVKLVCGLHKSPRYLAHLGTTGPSGVLGFIHRPSRSHQGTKHKNVSVKSWLDGVGPDDVLTRGDARIHRVYEVTCCAGPIRMTTDTARLIYESGQLAQDTTVDLPAFIKALPYDRK